MLLSPSMHCSQTDAARMLANSECDLGDPAACRVALMGLGVMCFSGSLLDARIEAHNLRTARKMAERHRDNATALRALAYGLFLWAMFGWANQAFAFDREKFADHMKGAAVVLLTIVLVGFFVSLVIRRRP